MKTPFSRALLAFWLGFALVAGCSSTTTEPTIGAPAPVEPSSPSEDAAPPDEPASKDGGTEDASATDAAKKRTTVDGPVDDPKSCTDVCEALEMVCVGTVDAAYERRSTGGIRHRTFDCSGAPPETINLPSIAEDGVLAYYTCTCETP